MRHSTSSSKAFIRGSMAHTQIPLKYTLQELTGKSEHQTQTSEAEIHASHSVYQEHLSWSVSRRTETKQNINPFSTLYHVWNGKCDKDWKRIEGSSVKLYACKVVERRLKGIECHENLK